MTSTTTSSAVAAAAGGAGDCCFKEWIAQQHQDLAEMTSALESGGHISRVIEKHVRHFQEYQERRAALVEEAGGGGRGGAAFVSPPWCTTFENAFLWIGGCRPSLQIRLVYTLCGNDLDSQYLQAYLRGERRGNLGDISAAQMYQIDALHSVTVRDEDKLSTRMASLQEDMVDEPLASIAKKSKKVGETSSDVERALDKHAIAMGKMVVEADNLRLKTLKELINILTPLQAAHLLLITKKLHLSIHEWSKKRDTTTTTTAASAATSTHHC